jgi:hypothetical protein
MTPIPAGWQNLPSDETFEEARRVLATGDREQIAEFLGRNREDRARAAAVIARSRPVRWVGSETPSDESERQ